MRAELRSELNKIVSENYVNYDRSLITPPNYEMFINLLNTTLFYTAPRRLSFREKQEVSDIIRDLLSKKIIRPSDSPYASPIVLVRKIN